MPRTLTLLIKPAGPDCNLRCDHCFYLEKVALFADRSRRRMSAEVLEGLLRNYLGLDQEAYAFCWQGGEPLLMGLPFFRQLTHLQRRLARRGSVILNSVQTNGLLIDEGLAAFFADWRFLLGVSLDGPQRLHDAHRRTRKGGGTHTRVMAGIDRLRHRGVPVNILTLVSRLNADQPGALYRYLVGQGFHDLQFIPLVDDRAQRSGRRLAISGEQWGKFLCGLFDAWWPRDVGQVSIRLFDAVAARLALGAEHLCTLSGDCRHYLVVEHDGSVYPCDFYVEPARCLGNIVTDSLADLSASVAFRIFGSAKRDVNETCRSCPHWFLCQGDCPANRDRAGVSRLCEGWRAFFRHTTPRIQQLADRALLDPSNRPEAEQR